MKKNEAGWDRITRTVLGSVLIVLAFASLGGATAAISGVLGAIFLATGIVGWCPLYAIFRVDTRRQPVDA